MELADPLREIADPCLAIRPQGHIDAEPPQTRRYPGMEHRAQDFDLAPEPTEIQRTDVPVLRHHRRHDDPVLVQVDV